MIIMNASMHAAKSMIFSEGLVGTNSSCCAGSEAFPTAVNQVQMPRLARTSHAAEALLGTNFVDLVAIISDTI